MITTVTTITTVTVVAVLGISTTISVAAIITLIVYLSTRELMGSSNSSFSLRIARFATIGILPLVIAFTAIVIVKIVELL